MHVYPGFIDAHSHVGTMGSGIGFEGDDVNEMTDILTPQLRIIDGIQPMDIVLMDGSVFESMSNVVATYIDGKRV